MKNQSLYLMSKTDPKLPIDYSLVGQTIGSWKIIEIYSRSKVKIECICGVQAIRGLHYVQTGRSGQCMRCYKKSLIAHKRFHFTTPKLKCSDL